MSVRTARPPATPPLTTPPRATTPAADPQVEKIIGFAQAARAMSELTDLDETLRGIADETALTFSDVGISLVLISAEHRPGPATVTQELVAEAEALQLDCVEGPSAWVLERGSSVRSGDLRLDSRWRFWAPLAANLGFRSIASVPVWDGALRGVLTAYSTRPSAFSGDDLVLLEVYAVHVSIALTSARERRAAEQRRLTAQAEGILMERFGIDASRAGRALQLHATRHQVDAVSVARQLLDHRTLTVRRECGSSPSDEPAARAVLPRTRVRRWVKMMLGGHRLVPAGGLQ